MSGPGGNSPPRDVGGEEVNCDSLVVDTTLNSPDRAVVNTLKIGMKLVVALDRTPQGRDLLVARTQSGSTAGSLTPPRLLDIINCMKGGHNYIAELLADPTGGDCRVRIRTGTP
jgi:hypothetical protein